MRWFRLTVLGVVTAATWLGLLYCPDAMAARACLGQSAPRVAYVGDSSSAGNGSWAWQLAKLCGWRDVLNNSVGATGSIVDKAGKGTYVQRIGTDVAPFNPSLVFVGGYLNDIALGHPPAEIAAAFAKTLDEIQALPTHPQVIVVGAYDPTGANGSAYADTDAALLKVCTERAVPFIEPRTGNIYDATGHQVNVVGNAGPWITTVNKAVFIADGVHETEAGQSYISERMLDAVNLLG